MSSRTPIMMIFDIALARFDANRAAAAEWAAE